MDKGMVQGEYELGKGAGVGFKWDLGIFFKLWECFIQDLKQ